MPCKPDCSFELPVDMRFQRCGDKHPPECAEKKNITVPTVRLSSGQDMPVLGFGTYKLKGYKCSAAIHAALDAGFRHFDTAFLYENELEVGDAIRTQIAMGNIKREDIFLVDKLWNIHHDPCEVRRACRKQLATLGMDYIDLYLLHFPVGYRFICDELPKPRINDKLVLNMIDYVDTWRAMEDLVREGFVRSIGVSNFNQDQIQRIIANCVYKPVVNQVELWPGFMQDDLVKYCRFCGIIVTAHTPLGRPNRTDHTPIYFYSVKMRQLRQRYKKKSGQIVLRYLLDSGIVPIPKAANPSHIIQNIDIFDFNLYEEDIEAFRGIKPKKRIVNYDEVKEQKHPFYPFESDDEDEAEQENIVHPEPKTSVVNKKQPSKSEPSKETPTYIK